MPLVEDTIDFDPTQSEFDPKPADEIAVESGERIAIVRTSDRGVYRRCRRRWGWSSHLKGNLGSREHADPLWLGSGVHFALEDFHGAKLFPSAVAAFLAFDAAFRRHSPGKVPPSRKELVALGSSMLSYYEGTWLRNRDPLTTFVWEGEYQVEVNFRVELPWERGRHGLDRVFYSGTIDRVIIDDYGQLWIVEYKTAKAIQNLHLALDPQCTNYCWAGHILYGQPIAGVIYQQHLKDIAHAPVLLGSGKFSTDKRMRSTHGLYRKALLNLYGEVLKAPKENVDFMNALAASETENKDLFIRRDRARRNEHQLQAEGEKILMEVDEMLNPNLALYPSPTRDCVYMCPFHGPCESLDDGSDWEYELHLMCEPRERVYDSWRSKLVYPVEEAEIING